LWIKKKIECVEIAFEHFSLIWLIGKILKICTGGAYCREKKQIELLSLTVVIDVRGDRGH
jgi:hypothetical protein